MTSKRFKKLPTKTTTIEPALIEKLIPNEFRWIFIKRGFYQLGQKIVSQFWECINLKNHKPED